MIQQPWNAVLFNGQIKLKPFVNDEALADASRELRLERSIRVSQGAKVRPLPSSVLASAYEALVGATFLEKGFDEAFDFASKLVKS